MSSLLLGQSADRLLCFALQGVLYGIFPAMLLGAFISYCYVRYRSRPVAKFIEAAAQAESNLVLKDVYHFKDVFEVSWWYDLGAQESDICQQ